MQDVDRARCICIAALAIAGCTGSLLDSDMPASTSYVLAPCTGGDDDRSAASQVDLSIGRPDVAPGLDTERIAVLRGRRARLLPRRALGRQHHRGRAVAARRFAAGSTAVSQRHGRTGARRRRLHARHRGARLSGRVRRRDMPRRRAHVTIVGRLIRVVDRALVATIWPSRRRRRRRPTIECGHRGVRSGSAEVARTRAQDRRCERRDAQRLRTVARTGEVAIRDTLRAVRALIACGRRRRRGLQRHQSRRSSMATAFSCGRSGPQGHRRSLDGHRCARKRPAVRR